MKYSPKQSIVAGERDTLEIIKQSGLTNPEEVGKELRFSEEYVEILIKSLRKQGYVRGTSITGYEVSDKGKALVTEIANQKGA